MLPLTAPSLPDSIDRLVDRQPSGIAPGNPRNAVVPKMMSWNVVRQYANSASRTLLRTISCRSAPCSPEDEGDLPQSAAFRFARVNVEQGVIRTHAEAAFQSPATRPMSVPRTGLRRVTCHLCELHTSRQSFGDQDIPRELQATVPRARLTQHMGR